MQCKELKLDTTQAREFAEHAIPKSMPFRDRKRFLAVTRVGPCIAMEVVESLDRESLLGMCRSAFEKLDLDFGGQEGLYVSHGSEHNNSSCVDCLFDKKEHGAHQF